MATQRRSVPRRHAAFVTAVAAAVASAVGLAQVLAPGPPGTLTFSVSGDTVILDWMAPVSGGVPTTYIVEAGSIPGTVDIVVYSTGNTATRLVARAAPGDYYVRVRAQNGAGTGPPSNEVLIPIGGPGCMALAPPATISGFAFGAIVFLSWAVVPGATSYVIEAGSLPGASNVTTFETPDARPELSTAAPSGLYYVRVRAKNACSVSAPSSEALIGVGSRQLLREDFNGTALDGSKWFMPVGEGTFIPRTQFRPPTQPLTVANGVIRLQIDTHNPTAIVPGDSFWGSEIVTRQIFARGSGLVFRARVRLVEPAPGGMVGSLFSYVTRSGVHDEIDFELLSNDIPRRRVLTNLYQDEPSNTAGRPLFATDPGWDLTQFNELEVRWLPDRIQWRINNRLVREETSNLPDEPMTVRLNFWVPAAGFGDGFNGALQPTANPAENRTFFYEVDWVEVIAL